jgi:hypothetical protein
MDNNCECYDVNDLSGPGSCCPPEEASVSNLLGVNRNCETRRLLVQPKTVMGVNAQGNLRGLTGSDDNPIILGIARRMSGDGGVVIQSTEGRILSVIPAADGAELPDLAYFGIAGGELKFIIPSAQDLSWADDEVSTVVNGTLATFTCAGNGRIKMAKYGLDPDNPIPDGEYRYMIMRPDGTVSYVDYSFDDCVSSSDEAIVDGILACKSGKIVTITPGEDEYLYGTGSGVTSKEIITGLTMINPVTAYAYAGWHVSQSGSYDLDLAGIPDTAIAVILKVYGHSGMVTQNTDNSFGMTWTINGEIAGRTYHAGRPYDGDRFDSDIILKYPAGGILNIQGVPVTATTTYSNGNYTVLVKGYMV